MTSEGQKRILVADDTLPMRIMLQDVLSEAGYEIVTAADGEEAWEIIQEEGKNLDLLIIDLLMPKMTGFDILERLKGPSAPPLTAKSLVITAIFKSNKEIQRLRELGAAGYITKSALVDEILFRVNQVFHLGQPNTRRHPRLLRSIPVDYRIRGESFTNFTSNLSAGGAFIRTIDPATPSNIMELTFRIPEFPNPLPLAGKVVWVNEYETYRKKSSLPGMGVEFVDLNPALRQSLEDFIRDQLQKEPLWLE